MKSENITVAAIEAHIDTKRKEVMAAASRHRQLASLT